MGREARKVPQQFSADAEPVQLGCSVKAQSSTTGGNNKIGSGKVKGRGIFLSRAILLLQQAWMQIFQQK